VKVDCLGIEAVRDEISELDCFSSSVTIPDLCSIFVKTKLRGLSPHANYTDRAAAAGRRS